MTETHTINFDPVLFLSRGAFIPTTLVRNMRAKRLMRRRRHSCCSSKTDGVYVASVAGSYSCSAGFRDVFLSWRGDKERFCGGCVLYWRGWSLVYAAKDMNVNEGYTGKAARFSLGT